MKLNGIGGVGTGKLGSMVYSVRNGQQIVRQYNPIVANPSTAAQVEVRSKMKLMSQLAAIVAPVIAMNSNGLKTKRNEFISKNYSLAGYAENTAQIDLARVQLTKSNTAMISFEVDRSGGQSIAIHLKEDATNIFDRVVYCAVIRQNDGSLRLWDSALVTEAGAGGLFPATLPYTGNAIAVYGYGIRANNEDAKAAYANLKANDAGKLAQILTSRNATLEAITISETRGAVLEVGQTSADSVSGDTVIIHHGDEDDKYDIDNYSSANGSATGYGVKVIGTQVTLTATPAQGYVFVNWCHSNEDSYDYGKVISDQNPYVFTAEEDLDIVPFFAEQE